MKRLLLLLACACSGGAKPNEPIDNTTRATDTAPIAREAGDVAPATGPSLYELPIVLTTSTGAQVGFDVARGKTVLVSMFYASCTVACPLIISELQQTLAELPADRDVHVLLVSFDGARDTPEKLATLVKERKIDARFTLAAANDADARSLAAVLGIKYRRLANGEFAHGSTIVALDGEGREIARTDSLGQRSALVRKLSAH